jgi:predicted dehydrogenase
MAAPHLRWGIIGCAEIAKKNARAMHLCDSATLVAVGSRDVEKAKAWMQQVGEPCAQATAYGSYEEVISNPNVDAIYIPLPTSLHLEWGTKCARAGKHILCEKPVAM